MKRSELLRKLEAAAKAQGVSFLLVRQGGNHTIYSFGGRMVPIARHPDIPEPTARGILRKLGA